MDSLNVYVEQYEGGSRTLAFTRTGDQGERWNRDVVTHGSKGVFRFVIEGVTSQSDYEDIALDDISLSDSCVVLADQTLPPTPSEPPTTTEQPCAEEEFYCSKDKTCIMIYMLCDFHRDCSDGADEEYCGPCTFEDGTCGWQDISEGIFMWSRTSPVNVSSQVSHPPADHTLSASSGHFMLLGASNNIGQGDALLRSPSFDRSTSAFCELIIWVYSVNQMNYLMTVSTDREHSSGPEIIYTSANYTYEDSSWNKVTAPMDLLPMGTFLTIDVYADYETDDEWLQSGSVLAIDDITYYKCSAQRPRP